MMGRRFSSHLFLFVGSAKRDMMNASDPWTTKGYAYPFTYTSACAPVRSVKSVCFHEEPCLSMSE